MLVRGGCSPRPPQLCLAHLRGAGGQAAWRLLAQPSSLLRWAPSHSQGCAQHLGVLRGTLWGRSVPGPPSPFPTERLTQSWPCSPARAHTYLHNYDR